MELPEPHDRVERVIRDAQADGLFDDLAGSGRPLPDIDRPYEPGWWARKWVERDRNQARVNDLLARLRRDVPRALGSPTEAEARRRLESLNEQIAATSREVDLEDPIEPIDVDEVIATVF